MKEIRHASMAFAAYLISSAVYVVVKKSGRSTRACDA